MEYCPYILVWSNHTSCKPIWSSESAESLEKRLAHIYPADMPLVHEFIAQDHVGSFVYLDSAEMLLVQTNPREEGHGRPD